MSMGIGTLETHPIDMVTAYGTIANGGVRMPRTTILEVVDDNGRTVWPVEGQQPKGTRVISAPAAYIITHILAGNTQTKINPYWGAWAIYDGDARRPAAYKTGTTSDNRDVHAYGYLAPPEDQNAPALVAGVWMGNSNNEPNKGSLSLDSSAPLWSAILTDVSKGTPIAEFTAPGGLQKAQVDAFTGRRPGPFTTKTVTELFIEGTVPKQTETLRVALDIDAASGLRWQEGCVGPRVTKGFFDLSNVEANFPNWHKANQGWAARAAKGSGVRGGPKGTRTSYFYGGSFAPFGRSWGAPFAPTKTCPLAPVEPPPCDPLATECPSLPPDETVPPGPPGKPSPTPKPTPRN
jgi:membrane peptidoglycan carboxypeptidase